MWPRWGIFFVVVVRVVVLFFLIIASIVPFLIRLSLLNAVAVSSQSTLLPGYFLPYLRYFHRIDASYNHVSDSSLFFKKLFFH